MARDYPSPRDKTSSITAWLVVLTVLVVIGIVITGFVLIFVLSNINGNERPSSADSSAGKARNAAFGKPAQESPVVIEFFPKAQGKPEKETRRSKRSPLVSSSSTFVEGSSDPTNFFRRYDASFDMPKTECIRRSLPMCNGQVPYNATVYPNYIGDNNELEAQRSLPYYNYIAKSKCNRRIKQLLCTFLEPPCIEGRPIPPCKKFCRIALEGCAEYVPATLELSAAFDCRRYPDSTDPSVCVNLAMGKGCASDEFQCPDKSCIPKHWLCDGVRDCIFAADEANCAGVGKWP